MSRRIQKVIFDSSQDPSLTGHEVIEPRKKTHIIEIKRQRFERIKKLSESANKTHWVASTITQSLAAALASVLLGIGLENVICRWTNGSTSIPDPWEWVILIGGVIAGSISILLVFSSSHKESEFASKLKEYVEDISEELENEEVFDNEQER